MGTLVMKFGGASVATPAHFTRIADLIKERKKTHHRIVIVVSAMGDTTDQLIELANEVNSDPPRREYDMLVSVGERISISLLAMALAKNHQEAVSFTGSQSGIITTQDHSNARILNVRPHRLLSSLDEGKVVIVAGFQGVSSAGQITTLGRGGSDTTAVALGVALQAVCVEFYKDVEGVYSGDPKLSPSAKLYPSLNYDQLYEIIDSGAEVLHRRSVKLAEKNRIPLYVRSFHSDDHCQGTVIEEKTLDRTLDVYYEG